MVADGLAERLLADPAGEDLARHLIDFDPRQPQHYLFAAAPTSAAAVAFAAAQLHPDPIPWPAGWPRGSCRSTRRSPTCPRSRTSM